MYLKEQIGRLQIEVCATSSALQDDVLVIIHLGIIRACSIGNNRKPVSERESGNLWLPIERRKPFSDSKPLTFDLTSVKQRPRYM